MATNHGESESGVLALKKIHDRRDNVRIGCMAVEASFARFLQAEVEKGACSVQEAVAELMKARTFAMARGGWLESDLYGERSGEEFHKQCLRVVGALREDNAEDRVIGWSDVVRSSGWRRADADGRIRIRGEMAMAGHDSTMEAEAETAYLVEESARRAAEVMEEGTRMAQGGAFAGNRSGVDSQHIGKDGSSEEAAVWNLDE